MLFSSSDGLAWEGLVATILLMADMLAVVDCRWMGMERRGEIFQKFWMESFEIDCANCEAKS